MGAESSMLENCDWEDVTTDGLWSVKHGKLADDSEISHFTVSKKDKNHYDVLRHLTKNLKSVRHPSILTYICSEEGSNGPMLVTEKALPLESVLPSLSSTEICAGLHTVLDGLHFLHENVGASHNNVHIGAVYVTADGSWRLGGLEHLVKFAEATQTFLETCKTYRHESVIAPEEKQGKVTTDVSVGHARDVFAFAVMTEALLEHMDDLGDLSKTFVLRIQDECLHSDPRNRPKVLSLLSDRIFNTDFLEIALFLKNITMKSEEERKSFFRSLLPKLLRLPEELVARRLLPGLLSRFVFLDQSAVENVLPNLLTPRTDRSAVASSDRSLTPLFSEAVYKQFVAPKLVKILSVHDYLVHLLLLRYFPVYIHLIDKDELEYDVFPQILLGLRDSSDQIASLSLHGLAEMIPILGRDVVIGGKSKKYFKETMPKNHSKDVPVHKNKQSSVHGVEGKVKLIDLANHSEKALSTKVTVGDADRKWKEREQRREEMKRKREERKLAREKCKVLPSKDDSSTNPDVFVNPSKDDSSTNPDVFLNPSKDDSSTNPDVFVNPSKDDSSTNPDVFVNPSKDDSSTNPDVFLNPSKDDSSTNPDVFVNPSKDDSSTNPDVFLNPSKDDSSTNPDVFVNPSKDDSSTNPDVFLNPNTNSNLHSSQISTESSNKSHDSHMVDNNEHDSADDNIDNNVKDSPTSDWSKTSGDNSALNDIDKADWSGGSDEEGTSDYSDEIERELQNMNIEAGSPVSASPKRNKPNSSKGSAMKLLLNKSERDKQQSKGVNGDVDKCESTKVVKADKFVAASSKRNPSAREQLKLGSEFDIKNLDIKIRIQQNDAVDFFADMTPTIETKAVYLNRDDNHDDGNNSQHTTDGCNLFSVNASIEGADGSGGWGDDDW